MEIGDAPLFTVGRGSDDSLQIADNALSRRHVQIERFGNVFIVTDANSSNGTKLNGAELTAPVALKNGDTLLLGDAIEITVELTNEFADYSSAGHSYQGAFVNNSTVSASDSPGSFFQSIFFIAPVFGTIILLLLGTVAFLLIDPGKPPIAQQHTTEDFPEKNPRPPRNDGDEEENDNKTVEPRQTPVPNNSNDNSKSPPTNQNNSAPISSDEERVEKFALQFLRDISGDSNAVLSSKQIALVNAKIKSLKNSGAFQANLKAAVSNKNAFEKVGQEHNLKANLAAAAALAKLSDSRGDAAATAGSIAPALRDYANVLGLELSNDVLIVTAAYAEGDAPNAIRDRIAALVKNTPNATVTTVRTVWFLHENNKLKPASFDFVLRFIAAGTIMQDPKSFGF